MLGAAGGAIGLAMVFPIRSLGPSPGNSLLTHRLAQGSPSVPGRTASWSRRPTWRVDGVITVFPEGQLDQADSQTLLIRVDPDAVKPERAGRTG